MTLILLFCAFLWWGGQCCAASMTVVLVNQVLLAMPFDPLSCFVINGNLANPLVNSVDVGVSARGDTRAFSA